MQKLINTILFVITFLSFYIIASVGLDLFWKIEVSKNASNINQVCLNLSYSYIAGLIFYFFISYLPFHIQKQKINLVIDSKIIDLENQIKSYLQTFSSTKNNKKLDVITLHHITELVNSRSLNDSSYYSTIMGLDISNYGFINLTKTQVFQLIDNILIYQKYLSSNQIIILEKIKDSDFFHLEKIYNLPLGKILVEQQNFKIQFISDLWQIIELLQNFKNQ